MKTKYLIMIGSAIFALVILANSGSAQDKTHEAAMSMLRDLFIDPAALQTEQNLLQFSPDIQKRFEKIALMIMQESGANAVRHVDAAKTSGPEGAFNSFSPAVQKEIQNLAKELERNPEFMKKAGSLR
jgi:hypothetical protein